MDSKIVVYKIKVFGDEETFYIKKSEEKSFNLSDLLGASEKGFSLRVVKMKEVEFDKIPEY